MQNNTRELTANVNYGMPYLDGHQPIDCPGLAAALKYCSTINKQGARATVALTTGESLACFGIPNGAPVVVDLSLFPPQGAFAAATFIDTEGLLGPPGTCVGQMGAAEIDPATDTLKLLGNHLIVPIDLNEAVVNVGIIRWAEALGGPIPIPENTGVPPYFIHGREVHRTVRSHRRREST
jgi:hypothetical protein